MQQNGIKLCLRGYMHISFNGRTLYFFCAIILLCNSSCFTKAVAKSATTKVYARQEVTAVASAFTHNGYLYINCLQKAGFSRHRAWHVQIALDTILSVLAAGEPNIIRPEKQLSKQWRLDYAYRVLEHTAEYKAYGPGGVALQMPTNALAKTWVPMPPGAVPAKVKVLNQTGLFTYNPFDPKPEPSEEDERDETRQNRQNIAFIYYQEKQGTPPLWYVGISIERRTTYRWGNFLLLPLSLGADIITAPVQLFFKGDKKN